MLAGLTAADQVRGVRKGPWKLHLVQGVGELYNLEEDPSERFNVAALHPERVEELRREIVRHVAAVKKGEPQTERASATRAENGALQPNTTAYDRF
jgi:arylsulfatase A-like enzyme